LTSGRDSDRLMGGAGRCSSSSRSSFPAGLRVQKAERLPLARGSGEASELGKGLKGPRRAGELRRRTVMRDGQPPCVCFSSSPSRGQLGAPVPSLIRFSWYRGRWTGLHAAYPPSLHVHSASSGQTKGQGKGGKGKEGRGVASASERTRYSEGGLPSIPLTQEQGN